MFTRARTAVPLRIERLGLRHAAGHPQDDHRVGRGFALRARDEPRLTADQRASVAAAVAPMKPRRMTCA